MLHTLNLGLQRLGVVLAMAVLAAITAMAIFVTVLVAIDAASTFGQ
jgi:hypothetical protein